MAAIKNMSLSGKEFHKQVFKINMLVLCHTHAHDVICHNHDVID